MKTKTIFTGVLMTLIICTGLAFAAATQKEAQKKADSGTILYVCNCGKDCKCDTVSGTPGKCECGKKTVAMHVLKIEDGEALLCTCGKKCACRFNEADPTKCGCGQPARRVSLKGMYVCGCGEGCTCQTISDKPGKCRCGNALKKVV